MYINKLFNLKNVYIRCTIIVKDPEFRFHYRQHELLFPLVLINISKI